MTPPNTPSGGYELLVTQCRQRAEHDHNSISYTRYVL